MSLDLHCTSYELYASESSAQTRAGLFGEEIADLVHTGRDLCCFDQPLDLLNSKIADSNSWIDGLVVGS